MVAATYVDPLVSDAVSDTDAIDRMFAIRKANRAPEYSVQVFLAQVDGTLGEDITADVVRDVEGSVTWDCTQPTPGGLRLGLSSTRELVWGSDIVAVYQLIRSVEFNIDNGLPVPTWCRFPVNHFVVTMPGFDDLDAADVRQVTGYDKNYFLQNQPSDSFAFDAGSKYKDAVETIFLAAGLISAHLGEVCDFPGDWATKTLPVDQPMNYPMDGSTRYLDIVNDLLDASGCSPIYTNATGRWVITATPKPATQSLRWRWAGSRADGVAESDLDAKIVLSHSNRYSGDVWNVPNQWVFVQDGLTFKPIEGSGQYTVNNTTQPPSDQESVGRIVRSTQFLQASGQSDLVTQGDKIVQQQLAQAEQINLTTTSWPVAGHFDVFQFRHACLPLQPRRRLQAQSWILDLWGAPMTWVTYAVAQA